MLFAGKKPNIPPTEPIILESGSETSSDSSYDKETWLDQKSSGSSHLISPQLSTGELKQTSPTYIPPFTDQYKLSSGAPPLIRSASSRPSRPVFSSLIPPSRAKKKHHLDGSILLKNNNPQPTPSQLNSSPQSGNLSPYCLHTSDIFLSHNRVTVNILVIGPFQAGKSTFINGYRAAVMDGGHWPSAPVGFCGFYGTTSIDPYPDQLPHPSCLLIDTPGYCYEAGDEFLIQKLVEGVPWKTKLVGHKAMTLNQIKDLVSVTTNRAHQCIVVIPANDLVQDAGWARKLRWQNQYIPASDASGVILYLKKVLYLLHTLLGDVAAFIVISKMDTIGGCDNPFARKLIFDLLGPCVPINRIFFSEFTIQNNSASSKSSYWINLSTRRNLRQLNEELHAVVGWMTFVKS